jgi:hypothetical protein
MARGRKNSVQIRFEILEFSSSNPDGQIVKLKLVGQYSRLSGSILKIGAKLQTEDANYTLLMQAPI